MRTAGVLSNVLSHRRVMVSMVCLAATAAVLVSSICAPIAHASCTTGGSELGKLVSTDLAGSDILGAAVAIDNGVAVVGAPGDDDDGGSSGAAYVFEDVGGTWQQVQKLTASDATVGARFGASVAIDGNTLVVGANRHPAGGTSGAGRVYVFQNTAGTWSEVAKFSSSDVQMNDSFGWHVDLKGSTIAVYARQDDDGALDAGSVYIYEEIGGTWTEIVEILADIPTDQVTFGEGIALSDDEQTLVVGDPLSSVAAFQAGAVYVFRNVGGTWTQIDRLTASDATTTDKLGQAVDISGDTIIAGAITADGATVFSSTGAGYVFRETAGAWAQIDKLFPADAAPQDNIGRSVAIDGDTIVLGSNFDDGCPGDPSCTNSGSIIVYCEVAGAWTEQTKITASDGEFNDQFGTVVALDGGLIIVGAELNDDAGSGSGSAYVFDWCPPCPGDSNGDGMVDLADLLEVIGNWGTSGSGGGDVNGDSFVDLADLLEVIGNWGSTC